MDKKEHSSDRSAKSLKSAKRIGHGGIWSPVKKSKPKSEKEEEWEEIGVRVEEKVRTGIQNWLDETDTEKSEREESEWEEIAKKVEEKIKRELRNWAEK